MSVRYHSVGPYEVLSRLGSGGMADVLKAVDGRNGRIVALKIPKTDPGVREAEREGALIQMRLSETDPRVPRVFEIDESVENEMYIAMEYVAGEDLSDRIRLGALEPREAVRIAVELCELLCTAQRFTRTVEGRTHLGIVHGDLKPKNVRLEPDGGVRVLDFGIAKALSLTRPLTRNEFGSLPYSSPERIESGNVDAHSDLWSVSVVLYEMLTGQQPFRGESTRRLEEFIRSRARPEDVPADCPDALAAVLGKALAPTLDRRYAGAAAMRDDLVAFLDGRPPLALADLGSARGYDETRRTLPAANGNHDLGDTRRTVLKAENESVAGPAAHTRRTLAEGGGNSLAASSAALPVTLPVSPAIASAVLPPALSVPRRRFRFRWRLIAAIGAVLLISNEAQVMSAASELKGALPGLPRGESDAVWRRYRQLGSRSILRVGTMGLSGDVKNWFVSSADELIADYRSDTPVIRESGWIKAASLLERAASISPGDRAIRARQLYCRGHLARINAQAAKGRRPADARRFFNDATGSFEEAANLRPRWLDPHLGLARTLVYGLEDPEAAREALGRAEEDGYQFGSRDLALLGDGYRLRAEKTWSRAADFRDLPQEDKYLASMLEDCHQALEHYETIPAYGEVSRNIRKVEELLGRVEVREDELREARLRKVGLGFLAPLLGKRR
ncbi:MAG: serine/threonine-protein kinase [Candidatus Eisenbacteria bacterium]